MKVAERVPVHIQVVPTVPRWMKVTIAVLVCCVVFLSWILVQLWTSPAVDASSPEEDSTEEDGGAESAAVPFAEEPPEEGPLPLTGMGLHSATRGFYETRRFVLHYDGLSIFPCRQGEVVSNDDSEVEVRVALEGADGLGFGMSTGPDITPDRFVATQEVAYRSGFYRPWIDWLSLAIQVDGEWIVIGSVRLPMVSDDQCGYATRVTLFSNAVPELGTLEVTGSLIASHHRSTP